MSEIPPTNFGNVQQRPAIRKDGGALFCTRLALIS